MYQYRYPRPMVTTDIVLICLGGGGPEVLLIERANEPYRGRWAFPGGFVDENEDLEAAAHRELQEETGLTGLVLTQRQTVGSPGRDPRGHTISVVYSGHCSPENSNVAAADDAARAAWFPLTDLPELAFDHDSILAELSPTLLEEMHRENE